MWDVTWVFSTLAHLIWSRLILCRRCPSRSHLVVLHSCCQIRALGGEFAWYQLPRYHFLRHISFNAAVWLHNAQLLLNSGSQRSSQKCQMLSNGQRNVTLLIYYILEVQVQAEWGKNCCNNPLNWKKKYQVFVCLHFYFFNFRSMKQLSVYNRKSTQDTQETWNIHRKENNWHFK